MLGSKSMDVSMSLLFSQSKMDACSLLPNTASYLL